MKVTYLSPLRVEECGEGGSWRLLESFAVRVEDGGSIREFNVPAGFETDFASVPRLPVIYEWMGNTCHRASVIHDWLYTGGKVSRLEADRIFAAAAEASGEPKLRVEMMYAGLRAFGEAYYDAKRKAEEWQPEPRPEGG